MKFLAAELSPTLSAVSFLIIGVCVGRLLFGWIHYLTPGDNSQSLTSRSRLIPIAGSLRSILGRNGKSSLGGGSLLIELGTGVLFAAFVFAMVRLQCQYTPSVMPDETWRYGRITYQFILIGLLIAATGTDFREYVIPDAITMTGIVIGIAGAVVSGELQIIHVWVDWNQEELFQGPYIPAWLDLHRHLHGLTWSLAGLSVGAGVTWLLRVISSRILGQEALGFGDVTLMAMIGSFVGWQPVVMIFVLAPLCGLFIGLSVRLISSRTYIPYGPYLSAATIVVLFAWQWLWTPMRLVFGHPPSLAILGGISMTALIVLLGLVRIYRTIPVTRRSSAAPQFDENSSETIETESIDE